MGILQGQKVDEQGDRIDYTNLLETSRWGNLEMRVYGNI
jgi:hypothetical protein